MEDATAVIEKNSESTVDRDMQQAARRWYWLKNSQQLENDIDTKKDRLNGERKSKKIKNLKGIVIVLWLFIEFVYPFL